HVVDGHQERMGDRDQGSLLAPALAETPVHGAVVAVRVAADVEGGPDHDVPDGPALAGPARALLPAALVAPWRELGPGRDLPVGGKFDISVPISPTISCAVCCPRPGIASMWFSAARKGRIRS